MYQLLFVDDDTETANEYAELVASFTKLRPIVCSKKVDAIEAVKKYPIAVAVLDQKMPEISGTDLYRQLLTINPNIRAIMLSGEAEQSEIGAAINLHYSTYLHKSDFRQLPGIVLREFTKFQNQIGRDSKFKPLHLFSVDYMFGLRGATEFWLEAAFVEEEDFIPADAWRLADQINCGEKKSIIEKVEISSELRFERTLESEIAANADIAYKAIAQIQSKLSVALKTKAQLSNSLKENLSRENKREISLPEEPTNPNELHVKSRGFYWAPAYRKIQCHIGKIMRPMNERNSLLISTLQPTGRIATKLIDVWSDGSTKEILTGIHQV